MVSVALAAFAAAMVPVADPLDLILDASAALADAEFVFEARQGAPDGEKGLGALQYEFEGRVKYVRGGGVAVEETTRGLGGNRLLVRERYSVRTGGDARFVVFDENGRPRDQRSDEGAYLFVNQAANSVMNLWPLPTFAATSGEDRAGWKWGSNKTVDGFRCAELVWNDGEDQRFCLDLEHCGALRRFEEYSKGSLRTRVHDVVVKPFNGADGKTAWLPVSGVLDRFTSVDRVDYRKVEFKGKPTLRIVFGIIEQSVAVNKGLTMDGIEVQFDRTRKVVDRRVRSRQPRTDADDQAPPVLSEVHRDVRAADAERVRALEEAGRASTRGWPRSAYWLAAAAGVVVALAVRYWKSRG